MEHFWYVEWDVSSPEIRETVPHPSVHLVTGPDGLHVHGLMDRRFTTTLSGKGRVFGIKFQPGAFFAIHQAPVIDLKNRVIPANKFQHLKLNPINKSYWNGGSFDRLVEAAIPILLPFTEAMDPGIGTSQELVQLLKNDPSILNLSDLSRTSGHSPRTLQRIFRKYLGTSPLEVIRRYRLHEAMEKVEKESMSGNVKINWANFALSLGYYDQSHFIRDFTRMVGSSPEKYSRRFLDRDS